MPTLKETIEQNEENWRQFVADKMLPVRCGHLRFEVKDLIKSSNIKILEALGEEIKEFKDNWSTTYESFENNFFADGYNCAIADILILISEAKKNIN